FLARPARPAPASAPPPPPPPPCPRPPSAPRGHCAGKDDPPPGRLAPSLRCAAHALSPPPDARVHDLKKGHPLPALVHAQRGWRPWAAAKSSSAGNWV
ncbi:MAG: hypothetical protein BJ554DRAFT_8114, partial [Olpidium bornovanus]